MYKTKTTKNKNSTFIPLIPKIGVPLTSAEYISKENHVAGNLNFENKVKKIEEKIVKKKKVFLNLNNDLVSVIATKYEENRLEVTCESKTFFCYSVVWRRKTNKKHKTWEGDGFLSTDGQLAVLQNSEGKEIGRSTGKIFSKEFGDGAELIISGKEIEVTGKIERNSFESGSCFINVSNDLKPINSTKNFEKFKSLVQNEEIKLKNSEPRHNPHSEGAIIMRRPVVHEAVVDVVIDPILSTKLREHQIEGVKFLYECVMNMKNFSGQGAILADEMGLGKTLQSITLIWTLLKQSPFVNQNSVIKRGTSNYSLQQFLLLCTSALILCPATLVKNWEKEFNKWLGTERIKVFCVDQNNSNIMEFNVGKIYPVLICTYEKMRSCMEIFKKANFDLIICDEGHRLKNAQIQTSIAIKNLQTKRRVILSGTPVQNDLTEFYSMCEFVNPGILGSLLTFKKVFEDPICKSRLKNCDADSKRLGSERMKELTRITKMFILRRTESINKNYLPPKTEIVLFIKQSEEQKNLYIQTIKNADKEIFDGTKINSAHVLELITLLKKVVNSTFCVKKKNEIDHYSLSNKELLKSSGKFNVVLVSNYNLDLIEVLCKNEEFKVLRLDGKTLISKRQSLIEKFNKDDKTNNEEFIFLLSAKAGGVGINLIGANRLILFDIDWNPSVCKQGNIIITYYFNDEFPAIFEAMARIWRDGQKKEVFIYRFITTGTIEERIFQRQVTKLGLSDSIMDDKSTTDGFSTRDLKDLFSFDDETPCLTHDLLECKCLHEKNYRLQNIDVNNSLVDLFNWKHFIIDKKKNAAENIIDDEILNSILKSKKNPNLESIADLADKKLDVKQKKETIKKMESNEKKNLYSKSDLLININPEVATTNFFNIFLTENSTIENLKKNILTFDKNTAEHFFEKLADSNCSINDNLQNFTNDSSHKIDLDIDSSLENSDSNIESSCNEGDEVSSSSSTSSKSEVLIKESEFDNPILPIENNKNVLVVKHNDIKLKENKYEPVEKNFLYKLQEKKDSGIDLGSKEEICSNNSQQKNLIFSKTVLSKFVEKRKKKLKTIEENFDLKISILNIFQTKNLELKKKNKKLKKNYVNLSIGSAYKNSSNSSSSSSLISENENWFSIKRITSEEELILKKEEKFNLGLKYNFNFDCYLNHLTKLNPNAADFNLLSLNKTEFVLILNFLEIPRYFNSVFFEKIIKLRVLKNRIKKSVFNLNKIIEIDTFDDQSEKTVNFGEFLEFWDNLISGTSDFQHLIFNLLLNNEKNEKNCPFLEPSDFESTLYGKSNNLSDFDTKYYFSLDLCDNNPGLAFLNGDKMIDFRKRYGKQKYNE
ncbi:helicase [Clydaea vesicula]|uniref:Helicase n=1 Tax=Clydaea vesicula TaxID=447962 RepID=A0AAD5Y3W2_9FUNG|nr:helicase [Clydaea vesicula]